MGVLVFVLGFWVLVGLMRLFNGIRARRSRGKHSKTVAFFHPYW
jgi:hypothetical protein